MAGTGVSHLRPGSTPVLRVEDLVVEFPARRGRTVRAVSGVSFDILPGETLGVVGESGCGKSSTGRAIMQLPRPTSGSVSLDGVDLTRLDEKALRGTRRSLQMIFQDPMSSLNPRRRIRDVVFEGLRIWGGEVPDPAAVVDGLLESVGLDPEVVGGRRPTELSGGQCQRVCIARAVALEPRVLICDEPVSALDVSVQAQILNLLEDLRDRYGLSLLFITHDLGVVKVISDRIVVMYLGKVCEVASSTSLFAGPAHPYTKVLLASSPRLTQRSQPSPLGLLGEPPSAMDPPSGCRFRTRCPMAQDRCAVEEPQVREVRPGHHVACHYATPT